MDHRLLGGSMALGGTRGWVAAFGAATVGALGILLVGVGVGVGAGVVAAEPGMPLELELKPLQARPGDTVTAIGSNFDSCREESPDPTTPGPTPGPTAPGPTTPGATTTPPERPRVAAAPDRNLAAPMAVSPARIRVEVTWDGDVVASAIVDEATGTFTTTFVIPPNAEPRWHAVVAGCVGTSFYVQRDYLARPVLKTTTSPPVSRAPTPMRTKTPVSSPTPRPSLTPTPRVSTLSPTPTPTPSETILAERSEEKTDRALWPSSVRTPAQTNWNPLAIIGSFALAAILVLLIGFPAEIFNKTYEENRDRIERRLRPLRALLEAWPRIPVSVQVLGFATLAAVLTAFVDPTFGSGIETLALILGLIIAFVVTTLAYELPGEEYARRASGVTATAQAMPIALAVAIGCALLSKAAGFIPGYVYGLFVAFIAVRRAHRAQSGRTVLISVSAMLGLSLLAWFAWQPISEAAARPDADFVTLLADAVLCGIFVLGIQNVVFGLIPLKFLDGHELFSWRNAYWAIAYFVAAFGLVHILLDPRTAPDGTTNSFTIARAGILFLVFGSASLLFWAYFRLRKNPSGAKP